MKKYFYLIFLACMASSCEMVVDVDVPRTPDKLVVNGIFEVNQPWSVKVNRSSYILDETNITPIRTASVKIFMNNQFIEELTYQPELERYYSENNTPVVGKEYKIEVAAPGFETVWASCKSSASVPIKSAKYVNLDINNGGIIYDEIEIKFDDLPGGSFYELSVLTQVPNYYYDEWGQIHYTDSIYIPAYLSSIDPSLQQDEADPYRLFSTDLLGDNKEYSVKVLVEKYTEISNLYFKLNHVSEEYYKYTRTLNNASWNSDNPFSEPVIVFSNIENGFGIFAGQNATTLKVEPKWTNGRNR